MIALRQFASLLSVPALAWSLLSLPAHGDNTLCDSLSPEYMTSLGQPLDWQGDRLRLTEATTFTKQGAYFTNPVSSSGNIELEFTTHSYGGKWGIDETRQGDGFAIVFSDAQTQPNLGGRGASMGYAQMVLPSRGLYESGFAGGYMGIALDEVGLFSKESEGRYLGNGTKRNSVAVRGRGLGLFGYAYLTGTDTLDVPLEFNEAGQDYKITLSPQGILNVWRDTGAGYEIVIENFDVPADNGPMPEQFYISVVASNGGATNIHEISAFSLRSDQCSVNLPNVVSPDKTVETDSKNVSVNIMLDQPLEDEETLTLAFSTRSGSALADVDFVSQTGTLEFNKSISEHTITIDLLSPTSDTQFYVDLTDYQLNGQSYSSRNHSVTISIASDDRDGDGVKNDDDVNPDNAASDSDQDGVNDLNETQNGSNPLDNCDPKPSLGSCDLDKDGLINSLDTDDDGDGVDDNTESNQGSDPHDASDLGGLADSDADGLSDLLEASLGTNPSLADTDGDGIPDGQENTKSTANLDTDSDGLINALDSDDDGDGKNTSLEDANTDGDFNPATNPTDLDNDGIPSYLDAMEVVQQPDDNVDVTNDSDNDGISDSIEKGNGNEPIDSDNDGTPDYLDQDSDNDGLSDNLEADGDGQNQSDKQPVDSDRDGIPDYIDSDSDNDGLSDQQESIGDSNNNGIPDYLDSPEINEQETITQEQVVETSVSGAGSLQWIFMVLGALLLFSQNTLAINWKQDWLKPKWTDGMDVYLGAGFGVSNLQPNTSKSDYAIEEPNDSGMKLLLGWDFNQYLTLESYYSKLGSVQLSNDSGNEGSLEYTAFGVHGLIHHYFKGERYQPGSYGVYAKVGMSKIMNSADNVNYQQNSLMQVTTGVGVEYMISHDWSIRAEFDAYDQDAHLWNISFVKRFGFSTTQVNRFLNNINMLPATAAGLNRDDDGDGLDNAFDDCPSTHKGFKVDDIGCAFYERGLGSIQFESGSAQMTMAAKGRLLELADQLIESPKLNLRILAHTDDQGSAQYNQRLSEQRAKAVKQYLVDLGISSSSLSIRGMGETAPIASNDYAKGRSKNRRVEFQIR